MAIHRIETRDSGVSTNPEWRQNHVSRILNAEVWRAQQPNSTSLNYTILNQNGRFRGGQKERRSAFMATQTFRCITRGEERGPRYSTATIAVSCICDRECPPLSPGRRSTKRANQQAGFILRIQGIGKP